eukprot:SAG31_NODE_2069_length_6520_cov_9.531226_3_plen_195_part_00
MDAAAASAALLRGRYCSVLRTDVDAAVAPIAEACERPPRAATSPRAGRAVQSANHAQKHIPGSMLQHPSFTAHACFPDIAGGIRVLEFTMTCPNRFEHIRDYSRRGFLVGLGTCLEADDAARGIAAGASFVVSPVYDPVVVQETLRADRVCIPGCNTPSEMCACAAADSDDPVLHAEAMNHSLAALADAAFAVY